jgi:transposase InsO family protein
VKPNVAPLKSLPIVGRPFELISADFVGPLEETASENRYIMTVIDHATRYVEAVPLPSADIEHAKEGFVEIFSRHGAAKQLLTDRGSVFTSRAYTAFLEELGTQALLTSSYRPESNGTIERVHGTLKTMLKTGLESEVGREWDKLLPWVLFTYRSTVHSATGFTPFQMMYGREPNDLLGILSDHWQQDGPSESQIPAAEYVMDLQEKLKEILQEARQTELDQKGKHATLYDRKHKAKCRKFAKGELVLVQLPLRGKPLTGNWQGPYPVL